MTDKSKGRCDMGMYDTVDFSYTCENCGSPLNEWQTKDGDCVLAGLHPSEAGNFYTMCLCCHAWFDAWWDGQNVVVEMTKEADDDDNRH